jgi:hypothetical protein
MKILGFLMVVYILQGEGGLETKMVDHGLYSAEECVQQKAKVERALQDRGPELVKFGKPILHREVVCHPSDDQTMIRYVKPYLPM